MFRAIQYCSTIIITIIVAVSQIYSQQYFQEGFEGDTTGQFKNEHQTIFPNSIPFQNWVKISSHKASGSGAVRFDTSRQGDMQDGILTMMNPINLSTSTIPLLSFYHMCLTESPQTMWDLAFVEISTDNGNVWFPIPGSAYMGEAAYIDKNSSTPRSQGEPEGNFFQIQSYPDWITSVSSQNAVPQSPGGTLWKKENFLLEDFKSPQFKLRFRIALDDALIWWGWALDSIVIGEPEFANDIFAKSIAVPSGDSILFIGQEFTPAAVIKNIGNATQSNVPVYFKMYTTFTDSFPQPDSLFYEDSAFISTINSGASAYVQFTPTAINSRGKYYATISSRNSGDENPANDNRSTMFLIYESIHGEYFVGDSSSLTSMADVSDFLRNGAIVGPTTFILNKPVFHENSFIISTNRVSTALNDPVVIKPTQNMNVSMTITGIDAADWGFLFNDASNVILDGTGNEPNMKSLTIESGGSPVMKTLSMDRSRNITVKNCVIKGFTQTGLYPTAISIKKGNDIVLDNLIVTNSYYGIYKGGGPENDSGFIVRNCVIGNVGNETLQHYALQISGEDFVVINNNTIMGKTMQRGIVCDDVRFSKIFNNNIHHLSAVSDYVYGIDIEGWSEESSKGNSIFNNTIYGFEQVSYRNGQKYYGIRIRNSGDDTVAFNTIFLTGKSNSYDSSFAFVSDANSGLVANNIFYNSWNDTSRNASLGMWVQSPQTSLVSKNNIFYTPGRSGFVGARARMFNRALSQWQMFGYDSAGIFGNPKFMRTDSIVDLHIDTSIASVAEGRGIPLSSIQFDKDGRPRDSFHPDVGAYEFNGTSLPGFSRGGKICGLIYEDSNGNGVRDEGENIIPNKKIYLSGTTYDSLQTDSGGFYQFSNLSSGGYSVWPQYRAQWIVTQPQKKFHTIELGVDSVSLGNDFGEYHIAVSVGEQGGKLQKYSLLQNYPNPFNPSTAISFQLSAISEVTLKIYNVLGQEVATLLNTETMNEGEHEIQFDASGLTSGVYFYKLTTGTFFETKKMLLMK